MHSKKRLFEFPADFTGQQSVAAQGLNHGDIGDETYGKKSMVYVHWDAFPETREEGEAALELAGDLETTHANQAALEAAGLDVLPVFHQGEDSERVWWRAPR